VGEAKHRGPRAARIALAQARQAELAPAAQPDASLAQPAPPAIRCSSCQAEVGSVDQMDVGALRGVELAYRGHCTPCDLDTWAVRGEAAAVRAFYAALEKAAGTPVQLGTVKAGPAH
jgi:hypothetical protein